MPTTNFDIYEADGTYLAVTNDVRRRILDALAGGDKQLPELVDLTEKSKATLSSIHLKELIDKGLVEGRTHPDDSRKKLFRLVGEKLGSSNVPLDDLREAVKEYVSLAPKAARFPLSITFDALAAADNGTDETSLRTQAHRLGLLVGGVLEGEGHRDLLMEIGDLVDREGLASPVRLDMEEGDRLVLERGGSAPRDADIQRVATLIGGFVSGVLESQGHDGIQVTATGLDVPDRFAIVLANVSHT